MLRARATISGLSGGIGVMTLYGQPAVLGDDDTTAALAYHRLRDALTVLAPRLGVGVSYDGVQVVDSVNPATGALQNQFGVDAWQVAGTAAFPELPSSSAACIRWSTGDFGATRLVSGRTFVSGLTSFSLADGGGILTETRVLLGAFATAWNDAGGSDLVAGVWRRPVGGAGGSFHGISGFVIPTQYAVLRSRRD